jgi:hypothetical protein
MSSSIVDRLHEEFRSIIETLERNEPSLRSAAEENFRKALLLSAASYFEVQIVDAIIAFVRGHPPSNDLAAEFVRRKALSRQFHTLFNWEASNANQFFGFFGDRFRDFMKGELEKDSKLGDSVTKFLEIGRERNRLVHQNFGAFALEKTTEEIFELYKEALVFVEGLQSKLQACAERAAVC